MLGGHRPHFKLFLFALSPRCPPGEVRTVTAQHFPSLRLVDIPAEATQDRQENRQAEGDLLTPAMVTLCTRLAKEHAEGPLFCNTRGKPWSRNAVRIRFRRLREKFPQLKGVVCLLLAAHLDDRCSGARSPHRHGRRTARTQQHPDNFGSLQSPQ